MPSAATRTLISRHSTGLITESQQVRSVTMRGQMGLVRIVDQQGSVKLQSPMTVWGYRQADGTVFRLYQGQFYQVIEQAGLCVYVAEEFGESAKEYYYFSRTPDSELVTLTRQNLSAAFQDDACMQAFVANTRLTDWLRQRKKGPMGLLKAYQNCALAHAELLE